ncbi:MAG: class I SAM-dependent methyltransferase [Planctomycetota bacterium]
MSRAEREKWNATYRRGTDNPRASGAPAAILDRAPAPPRPGAWALDLGCGTGRHARALAERGWEVLAVDAAAEALLRPADSPRIRRLLADLDHWRPAPAAFDLIVDVHFLDRSLAPALAAALRPGGSLLMEIRLGELRPGEPPPPFRLLPGESERLFPTLEVLWTQEEMEEGGGLGRYHLRAT